MQLTWETLTLELWRKIGLCGESYAKYRVWDTPEAAYFHCGKHSDMVRVIGHLLMPREAVGVVWGIAKPIISPYRKETDRHINNGIILIEDWIATGVIGEHVRSVVREALWSMYYLQGDERAERLLRVLIDLLDAIGWEKDRWMFADELVGSIYAVDSVLSLTANDAEYILCRRLRVSVPWERLLETLSARWDEIQLREIDDDE